MSHFHSNVATPPNISARPCRYRYVYACAYGYRIYVITKYDEYYRDDPGLTPLHVENLSFTFITWLIYNR